MASSSSSSSFRRLISVSDAAASQTMRETWAALMAHLPIIGKNLLILVFIMLFCCGLGFYSAFAEMAKYDVLVSNMSNASSLYVTPTNSEGALVRIGLFVESVAEDERGMYAGPVGFQIGNFVVALGSFVFTAIAIVGPVNGYEKLRQIFTGEFRTRTMISFFILPIIASIIWIVRGIMFFEGSNLDKLNNTLYQIGILIYLVSVFLSMYNYVYVFDTTKSSTRKKWISALNLGGPSVMSAALAAVVFPRMVMPIYVDPDTSDFMRGLLSTTLPSAVFFMFYTWQRLGTKSLKKKYGEMFENPKYTCLPLIIVASFWTRVLISGNVPTSTEAGFSVTKRLPLLATATLASSIQCLARRTEVWRDRWIERLLCCLCCNASSTGDTAKIVPAEKEDEASEKAKMDDRDAELEKENSDIGYLLVADCIMEFTMILWFPTVVAFIEIAVMNAAAGEAILACVVNIVIQLIPELFFTFVIFHITGIKKEFADAEIKIVGPWILVGFATAVAGAVALAVYGITDNIMRGA